ncbi:uncharacterized protein LOC113930297 [Zalophus californianus]|uniref:Uncharacterized protein LOC113930297 n=1 Tax=Zalophus californianus TaxID=9704 RepID=A0A6J2E3A1_ZALCA|nr:uncharacterized protein LOC113930297 [Zalophus californianus]XP_027463304.1 uncharacterized protein LOC113930297 [Zalophus californianus]
MEKDILTHVEAPVTQASDTDPGTLAAQATAQPEVQIPLEGALLAASSGENVGQQSPGPGENEEMENRSVLILSLSTGADGQCPDLGPVDAALQGSNTWGNAGRKGSRKRRNRKQTKIVYLPWPLTLQTRASSAAPVLGQSRVLGALGSADTGDSEAGENRGQGEDEESENTSILTEPQEAPADALWPATSAVQPSLEEASLAADEGINTRQKKSRKGRNKKNKMIMASPWPLTVYAWASYTDPAQAQMASAGDKSLAKDGVDGRHQSQGPEGEAPDSAEDLELVSWEEGESLSADSMGDGGTSRHTKSNRKEKSVLACPWPLTVQAWASFGAADEVQTHLQGKSSAASMEEDVGQKNKPQLENSEEETKSTPPWPARLQAGASFSATAPGQVSFEGAPSQDLQSQASQTGRRSQEREEEQVQSKAEQTLEAGQGWRSTKRHPGDQDFWECTVMNFAKKVDCCYCGELCSQEQMEALTLTKAHTHISTSVMGMQGPEKERAESQAVWMGKWEGF